MTLFPLEEEVFLKSFTNQPNVHFTSSFPELYYLSTPAFQCRATKDQVIRMSQLAKEEGKIDPHRIWLGVYHEKQLLSGLFPKVSLRWIQEEIGYGLFSMTRIEVGSLIGEYTGVIQPRLEKHRKESQYCVLYTSWPLGPKQFVIDAETKGNFTRFINHSKQPNAALKTVYWRGAPRILVLSTKSISPEEQITLHYGKTYWKQMQRRPL